MTPSYYVVQVQFQNKWVDLIGGKFYYDDSNTDEHRQHCFESAKRLFASAQKRAKEYRHRILSVSVIEQTPNPDSWTSYIEQE